MAITPIDLQMLFSQIDKIGKEVAAQKEGAALHSAIQTDHRQKINEEKMQSVREADDSGEGLDRLKDKRNSGGSEAGGKRNDNHLLKNNEGGPKLSEVHDPNLGNYLDISG
jgi:hypothetical protein